MTRKALAIEVRNASKVYRTRSGSARTAVQDVSLKVPKGSVHGLLGPNGAGKTTTLKMLLGLVRPTGGEFLVMGRDATSPEGRDGLGFLPEQPYFPVQLTAKEALGLYGRLSGLDGAALAEETERLLVLVGLEGRGHESLTKYSRGMLQRLGVAQALLGDPQVVVLDEPASGLDPVGQRDMRCLMLALRDEGRTVLLSSHQLSEVEAVCDRVTIVNRGRVAAEGRIEELLDVAGQASIRARLLPDPLPKPLARLVEDVAVSDGAWVFSVLDANVRAAVNAIDKAGGSLVSVNPKRDSLEDFFTRMLEDASAEEEAEAGE